MKWIVLWFALSGAEIHGLPPKDFTTEAECHTFANSRVGMVALIAGERVRFECRALPFVEPKP
jgi:hypothetical protein